MFSAFEIWFKQVLFDMDSIIEIFDDGPVSVSLISTIRNVNQTHSSTVYHIVRPYNVLK